MKALLLILLLALSVHAIGGAEVKASILRYEPTPAEQGNTVDAWMQLSNAGTKADRVAIKFIPDYPFSLPAGQQEEVDVGIIAATESKVVKYTVFVDGNAPNGDRNITFLYKYGSLNEWTKLETPITLQTQNAVLIIDQYKVTPSPISPGQTVKLQLTLRNSGKIDVKNIDASIDLEDGKFSTIGSGAKQRIDAIPAGESETITFTLASDTSTEVKVYGVPVTLSYQDARNKQYNDTAKISLVVNAQPELSLTVDSTDFPDKKSPGKVNLKVVNKGVVNLKYVTITLGDHASYEILSPSNENYVGNLDSDDFETAEFTIKPLTEKPLLLVKVDFKDPYNVDYSKTYELPMRIITAKDLGKDKTPVSLIVGAIVIIAAAAWYFRRKKR
ncbi:LPXTG cell wall anchor domain-containing protein [Candidatus Woesearchaeota archaeon]|nr:LPXTG cell wall anchor domain-containing protein [Candidatus Woesearchaeota archaeon]